MNTAAAVRQIKADQEVKATAVATFKDPPPINTFAKKALKNFKFALSLYLKNEICLMFYSFQSW